MGATLKRFWVTAALASVLTLVGGAAEAARKPQAYQIRIKGMITDAYARAVERKIEYARGQGVKTIILELNTPGGTLGASAALADYIFQSHDIDFIAYVHPQAFSGGTMVALACKEIYITAGIGKMGDVAPVGLSGEIANEKIQSVVRESMLNYARARGYPEALVEAMVTKEIEVYRVQMQDEPEGHYTYMTGRRLNSLTDRQAAKIIRQELVVPGGHLLTMGADKAVEFGFARKAVRSPLELYDALGLDPGAVDRLYLSASERLLTFLDAFSPFLIIAGFVLLFIELTHPGFGLPGILGIGCFVTFFLIKWTLLDARLLELVLFLGGAALLAVEVFVTPGFGVIGVAGIALMFVALVLAFQEFGIPRTSAETFAFQVNLLKVGGSFAATIVVLLLLARMLPTLPVLGRLIHRADLAAAQVGTIGEARTPGLSRMVGQVGVAVTPLHPAGRGEFGDTLLDVVTEGEFIEKGTPIRIEGVRGNTVVVAEYREP